MGTIIEATGIALAHERTLNPGALELADVAARSCLDRAHRTAGELDLLINVGLYHDKIISEPAFASLIQQDIGANLGHPPGAGHGTLSFDVYNGACGLLTGINLVDGMLASGTAQVGMVVASDMDPMPGVSRGFDYPAVGGAVLLSEDPSREGFTAFRFDTFPEFAELSNSYVDWQDDAKAGLPPHGGNMLTIEIADSYAARALECAESTVRELAQGEELDFGEVDLLVASASVPGFAKQLASALGVPGEWVVSPSGDLARAHTAGLAVALESGRLAEARTTLFVSAGSGIAVAAALYRT